MQDHLGEWLGGISATAVGQGHTTHRAVISVSSTIPGEYMDTSTQYLYRLNDLQGQVNKVLEKSMSLFGDKLYIKHTPTLHQEG